MAFRVKPALPSRRPFTSARRGVLGLVAAAALVGCAINSSAPTMPTTTAAAGVEEPASNGTATNFRLVTGEQYFNTLAYVFGPDVRPIVQIPSAERVGGLLQVGATRGGVSDSLMEAYKKAAIDVAAMVIQKNRRDYLIGCTPARENAADDKCARAFISRIGPLLFRRPLAPSKADELVALAGSSANKLGDFYGGLATAIEALLVSPKTLFVTEVAEPDPAHPGQERLEAFSLASRLSYFLWNAAPDEALLKAAETGEIQTEKGRAKIVDMMLASPRLEAGVRAFFDDMFAFDAMSTLTKDAAVYPAFIGDVPQESREQTLRTVVDQLVVQKNDYRELFTTRETFLSPLLGALYGVPTGDTWMRYEFPPDSPRAGILTQISFLSLHSHPGRSSATLRGKALRETLLCQTVPPPPPNVDFSALENAPANLKTARQRVAFHLTNPACAGCHRAMDPMGLALEHFDGAGQYRDQDNGAPIDSSGNLDDREFSDAIGLGKVLYDSPRLPACLVQRTFSYATSNSVNLVSDRELLAFLNTEFATHGYQFPTLLRAIALSKAFSKTAPAKASVTAAAVSAGAP